MVAHVVATLLTSYLVFLAWPGSSLFSWHPTFMTLAFVLCMTEAILVFNPQSSLVAGSARMTKSFIHKILQICTILFASLGFLAIFYNKSVNDKPHFTSWHSWFGAGTLLSLPVSAMWGNMVYYPWLRALIRKNEKLAALKLQHATAGLVTFSMASLTIILGFYSTWFVSVCDGLMWYVTKASLSCLMMIVLNQVTSEYLPKAYPQQSAGTAVQGNTTASLSGHKASKNKTNVKKSSKKGKVKAN